MQKAIDCLKSGQLIAYPTEAVYGLGCDPFNEEAVNKIKQLKNRKPDQGFILIASTWSQIENLIEKIPDERLADIKKTWPGPNTWVFPASNSAPSWVCSNNTIALRITDHDVAKNLCDAFGKPIVSTSANPNSKNPAITAAEVKAYFPTEVDYILAGNVGDLKSPTQIRDAMTGKVFRS